MGERIAAVDRAEDRAAEPQDAGDIARRQHARAVRLEQAVEAVFEADALDAGVAGRLDDGADDGVQAGRVAAAGEDADAFDRRHAAATIANARSVGALRAAKSRVLQTSRVPPSGRLAQLGERRVRNAEVGSSILLPSTNLFTVFPVSIFRSTPRFCGIDPALNSRGSFPHSAPFDEDAAKYCPTPPSDSARLWHRQDLYCNGSLQPRATLETTGGGMAANFSGGRHGGASFSRH